MDVGRVCYKIAGREAGKLCVIVDVKDRKFVIIHGNVRRKLCNVSHLEPTDIILKIKKGASTSEVHAALQKEKLEVKEKKKKEKKTAEKPKKKRKISSKEKVPKKEVKKKK